MFNLKYKIWLESDGRPFGQGIYNLLNGVREKGSLSEAARCMDMSYNKAHTLIKDVEKRFDIRLLESKIGGTKGGGSCLTEESEILMKKYSEFCNECEKNFTDVFDKIFNDTEVTKNK
jgi:molybdate transport system regulatory protein